MKLFGKHLPARSNSMTSATLLILDLLRLANNQSTPGKNAMRGFPVENWRKQHVECLHIPIYGLVCSKVSLFSMQNTIVPWYINLRKLQISSPPGFDIFEGINLDSHFMLKHSDLKWHNSLFDENTKNLVSLTKTPYKIVLSFYLSHDKRSQKLALE